MSEISGVGGGRHFTRDEEEELRREESTSTIVKRDTKIGVELYGTDRTQRQVKEHQQTPGDNKAGLGLGLGHAAFEGLEVAGMIHVGAAGAIGGAALGLFIGIRDFEESKVKGEEQARAVEKDSAHVALIGTLDLPAAYKQERLDKDYAHVPRDDQSRASRMGEALNADPKGRMKLQLHADRGMNAARDLARSGMKAEAFLKANPKIAEAYRNDAAFKEGFDAYLYAKAKLPANEVKEMERKLDERDGWYAQSQVQYRV